MNSMPAETVYWPFLVYAGAVLVVVFSMLLGSWLLGQRHNQPATGEPYESGIITTGTARLRFAARFYLLGMFFLIFDLEVVFLFAWAVAAKELGWAGYLEAVIFIFVLAVALIYLWRMGALEIVPPTRHSPRRERRVDSPDLQGVGLESRPTGQSASGPG